MIDFNKELEYDNLADEFIEAFKTKTALKGNNDIPVEDFAGYIKFNNEILMIESLFDYDIKDIHFQVAIEVNEQVTLQQIIDQNSDFLTISVYHFTEEEEEEMDSYEDYCIKFTSPDFRFLKKLKNTICDILRKHESKAS